MEQAQERYHTEARNEGSKAGWSDVLSRTTVDDFLRMSGKRRLTSSGNERSLVTLSSADTIHDVLQTLAHNGILSAPVMDSSTLEFLYHLLLFPLRVDEHDTCAGTIITRGLVDVLDIAGFLLHDVMEKEKEEIVVFSALPSLNQPISLAVSTYPQWHGEAHRFTARFRLFPVGSASSDKEEQQHAGRGGGDVQSQGSSTTCPVRLEPMKYLYLRSAGNHKSAPLACVRRLREHHRHHIPIRCLPHTTPCKRGRCLLIYLMVLDVVAWYAKNIEQLPAITKKTIIEVRQPLERGRNVSSLANGKHHQLDLAHAVISVRNDTTLVNTLSILFENRYLHLNGSI